MMQLLPSLHIVLTCSFVLVLAYFLSTFFSYLASSFIHGSSAKPRRQSATPAPPRSRRPPSIEIEPPATAAAMDRLQEENEDDQDVYSDAPAPAPTATVTAHAPGFKLADSIFDDGLMLDGEIQRDEYSRQCEDEIVVGDMERRDNSEQVTAGMAPTHRMGNDDREDNMGNAVLDEADGEGTSYGDAEDKEIRNELSWDKKEGEANVKEGSKLGDAEGSSSPQQRLPPTWSDLERLVNLNSRKDLLAPTVPAVIEE